VEGGTDEHRSDEEFRPIFQSNVSRTCQNRFVGVSSIDEDLSNELVIARFQSNVLARFVEQCVSGRSDRCT
jgi:hypothetical protein